MSNGSPPTIPDFFENIALTVNSLIPFKQCSLILYGSYTFPNDAKQFIDKVFVDI